jgi:hypothetical protein
MTRSVLHKSLLHQFRTLCLSVEPQIKRRFGRLASTLLLSLAALSLSAHAVPVTYVLVVFGVNPTPNGPGILGPIGQLGNVSFGGSSGEVILTFTLEGDTSNVEPWSVVVSGQTSTGYEIRKGIASVEVKDSSTGVVLAQGTFDPTAGIFVSIDNTNFGGGIGFGSHAVWLPTDLKFPGEPVYPFGAYLGGDTSATAPAATYDLKSNYDSNLVSGFSCVAFATPNACQPPIILSTTAGPFHLDVIAKLGVPAFFHTIINPIVVFSIFHAQAEIRDAFFKVRGRFTLGSGSNGINPVTDVVTLQLNNFNVTLPSGSLKSENGEYVFRGIKRD